MGNAQVAFCGVTVPNRYWPVMGGGRGGGRQEDSYNRYRYSRTRLIRSRLIDSGIKITIPTSVVTIPTSVVPMNTSVVPMNVCKRGIYECM